MAMFFCLSRRIEVAAAVTVIAIDNDAAGESCG